MPKTSPKASSVTIPDEALAARLADFFNEVGMLRHTPRSGYRFLGSGKESVAEHSYRTTVIGYALAKLEGADTAKTMLLCLFHDLPEARTGDFNYVNKMYNTSDEATAFKDAVTGTQLEDTLLPVWDEHTQGTTLEAKLAADADQLDMILNLKREADIGNTMALTWIESAVLRLQTPLAKELAKAIQQTHHTHWWYMTPDSSWWIKGKK